MLISPFVTLIILASFFTMAGAFAGWGTILGKLCRISYSPETEKEEKMLMGLPCLYLLAGLWNFFLPIDLRFVLPFILIGLTSVLFRKKIDWHKIDRFFVFSSLFFVCSAFTYGYSWDFDMYHADTIRWINDYAVVPGLGNLQSRFGFNQFFFYLPAVFRVLLPDHGWSVVNLFLGWIAASYFWNTRKIVSHEGLSILVIGAIAAFYLLGNMISVPHPDTASFLFQIILLCAFTWQFKEKKSGKFSFFLFLSVAAVLTKFSNAMVCIVILLILFFREQNKTKILLYSLPFAFLLGGVWCTRSVILTGYMFYPIAWPSFNVEWKLPLSALEEEQAAIVGIARHGGPFYRTAARATFRAWIPHWARHEFGYAFILYIRWMLAGGCLSFLAKKWFVSPSKWIGLVPASAGILFCFLTAPDPRFASGVFWFVVILPFSVFLEERHFSITQIFLLILTVIFIAVPYLNFRTWTTGLYTRFQPRIWRHYDFRYTNSGLLVSYAENSYEGKGPFSGMAPLPATPFFNPDLALRGKDLQSGFIIRKKQPETGSLKKK